MSSDDDDGAGTIIIGKLKKALNYYVSDLKLWHLLAGALVAFVAGAWVF